MASHTGRWGALEITGGVAQGTRHADVCAGQFEGELVMIKVGNFPGRCVVTGIAGRAKSALMNVILRVTRSAIGCQGLESSRYSVAFGTQRADMRPGQLESSIIVIEGGRLPGRWSVTAFAGSTLGAAMHISSFVTTKTGSGGVVELGRSQVTLGANHAGMRTHQGENTAVIECCGLPGRGGMAFLAGGAFAASMHVLGCMASYAGCGGAFKITIGVALGALHADVCTSQLEGELVVIKVGNLPGRCVVTGTAVRAESALMSVILLVAAETGHRRVLELEGGCVAACAKQSGMLAFQFEDIEVIESGRLPSRGIVAAFAGCAFSTGMFIILLMTAYTSHRSALIFAIDMALPTLDTYVRTS
jgi:hypothetical protein